MSGMEDHLASSPAGAPPAWLLLGRVMHERLRPARHRFVYPVFYLRCNLDRLPALRHWWFGIDRWAPLSLATRDYGPRDGSDLAAWMRKLLVEANLPADGEIWLQTFPRVFGYAFNPVSFWHCHDRAGQLRAVLAEVNNTFGASHRYLLCAPDRCAIGPDTVLSCHKALHVSPFCVVEGSYAFRLRDTGGTSFAGVDYYDATGLVIRTAIGGRRLPFSRANVLGALARQPWLTVSVMARIHWQALCLWLKKVPFRGKDPGPGADPPGPTSFPNPSANLSQFEENKP